MPKITYRQQFTRCGKQRCRKCREGKGHGPYWYAYWHENGRTMSKYIGVHPPAHLEVQQEAAPLGGSITQPTNQDSSPVLRIYVLGQFRVERRSGDEWLVVANRTWHRRRARALLGLLLSNPGRRLAREQAMEALWPDLDVETAANRLNGAVHELRQVLEPEIARPAASHMLRLEREVLILADAKQMWVDAEAFDGLLNEANVSPPPSPEQVEPLLEQAAALYKGDYLLEELYSEWAAPRREALRRGWIGLLLNLAELRAAKDALTRAIEPLDRLLATEPTHETAVRQLMIILTQLDRRGEALQVYQRLASVLQRDYESDPLPETRELYEALRQGHLRGDRVPTPLHGSEGIETRSASSVESPDALAFRSNQSPLIGRERELENMRRVMLALEGASNVQKIETHSPHFLLLMGEAGIGKTRLAEELSQEANTRRWSVAWSRAYEQEATIPYRLWTELLRALLQAISPELLVSSLKLQASFHLSVPVDGSISIRRQEEISNSKLERLSALLPELRDMLPSLRSPSSLAPLPPEQERLHLWEATAALLGNLSRTKPLLLVLDDLHWTDESSLALLAYLVRHMHDQPILLVGTCRDIELAPTHNLRTLINDLRREQAIAALPVQPLTRSQIGSLVAHLPQNIVQSIQTQAAGNPFFAEELARYSGSELTVGKPGDETPGSAGLKDRYQPEARSSLPETIATVLDRRLARLSSECRTLLGKAAVLGGSFELSQVLFMTNDHSRDEDTLLDLLEEALHAGLLTEEGSGARVIYHFWHPLIVSHLYDRLSAARRTQLHRRAANALLHSHQGHEEEVAAVVTHHLSKGGGDPLQTARYAELAGHQAYTLSAYAEAQRYYRQVISIIADGPTVAFDPLHLSCLLERVGECSMVQGDYEEARHLYERVLELREREAGVRQRQQEAQRQALIWREIGRTWTETGEYTRAHECYRCGKQVMYEAGVTFGAAWACLHLQQGIMCWREGNYEEAARLAREALAMHEHAMQSQGDRHFVGPEVQTSELQTRTTRALIGDPLEVGLTHEILGVIAATVGQLAEALKHLNTALAMYEQHDLVIAMAMVCGNLGATYTTKAKYTVARTYYHRSLGLAERMGDVPNMAFVTGNLGDVAARLGDLLEAEEWFKRSLALSERINDREHLCWCNVVLATAQQDQGNLRGALESIHRALRVSRAMKSTRWIGFALVALGDLRVTQAIAIGKLQAIDDEESMMRQSQLCKRLLLRAQTTLQRALALEGLETETVIEGWLALANVYFLLGDLETAQQKALQAMEEARQLEMNRTFARSQRLFGRILAAQGQEKEADSYFEQAIQLFRTYEMRLDCARALHGYGVVLVQRSMALGGTAQSGCQTYQKGLTYLHEARDIFTNCHAAIDLEWVERILTKFEY